MNPLLILKKITLTLCLSLLLSTLLPLSAQESTSQKLVDLNQDVKILKEDVRSLQKDISDNQKFLLNAGVTANLKDDIRSLQLQVAEFQKGMTVSAPAAQIAPTTADSTQLGARLEALTAEYKALAQKVSQVSDATTAPDKTTSAAPVEIAVTEGGAADIFSTQVSTTLVWVLVAAFLVVFMQAGFALVECGFSRAKNAAHIMTMNFMDYALAALAFWAFGFAIMFGNAGALANLGIGEGLLSGAWGITIGGTTYTIFGTNGWFLGGDSLYTGGIFTLFIFQMAFAATANTIATGTLAERWKFSAFAIAAIVVPILIYPVFGHWVWGGGWLAAIGFIDFAGSTVVHMTGGVLALVGAKIVGPRLGKFNPDGSSNPIPGHNIPYAIIGTMILGFGWFGFNCGSSVNGNDAQIGIVAVNTALASAAGAIAAFYLSKLKFGKPDASFACNGYLGGLVAITAPCAFVDAWAAVLIGLIGGILVVFSVGFIEDKLRLDDPVGAISVHGVCGAFGGLAVGLFANGKYGVSGLFFGDGKQLLVQSIGVLACFLSVGILGYILFTLIDKTVGNRTTDQEQAEGLDLAEMGIEAYAPDYGIRSLPKPEPTRVAINPTR